MQPLDGMDPRQVGPYTLVGRLGAGGMGAVYLGRSAGGRAVAVKVVRPELAEDTGFRQRFRQEVAAARRVSGAFTAPVVDADPEAALPWMATAFVPGLSLRQAVERYGPLPVATVRTLAAGLAEALAEVHRAGLIHRDLKPGNVLLALDGPHVIDFGISRAADAEGLTTTGAVIGSAPYMSPEQALGERLTPVGDVFSLGSTVAYAALGRNLFGEGAGAAVLFRIVNTDPDLGELPADLRTLVAACLAKNPAHRPTPRQLVAHVALAGHPADPDGWLPPAVATEVRAVRAVLTAPPAPPPMPAHAPEPAPAPVDRPPSHGPRRRTLLALGGGVLAAGAAGSAYALIDRGRGTPSGKQAAAPVRPSADVPEAVPLWQNRQVTLPCVQLLSLDAAVVGITTRQTWAVVDDGKPKWTLDDTAAGVTFALDPLQPHPVAAFDGHRIQLAATGGAAAPGSLATVLLAIDPGDGKVDGRVTLDQPQAIGVTRFAGIRGGIAYVVGVGQGRRQGGSNVWAVDLAGRRTAWFHGEDLLLLEAALLPGGDRILVSSADRLKALDATGAVAWTAGLQSFGIAAGGGWFLTPDKDGALTALDPATGRPVWSAPGIAGPRMTGSAFAHGPDDSLLHCLWTDSDGGYSVGALDLKSGTPRRRTPLPPDGPGTGAGAYGADLLYADDTLYRIGRDAVVWALDPATGRARWKYSGLKGADPTTLTWTAGAGRLCIAAQRPTILTALPAKGH
ncbi:protein kinase domain-containing protein [Kitasatospora griseola]|uniref:serine/threonine-protein kinase n=1 Tax=Kitasatospora griseola TaxID=2064 RepID=UPI0009F9F31C|nr:serine/threonine-protein kinase [Kitasatospora griseola]